MQSTKIIVLESAHNSKEHSVTRYWYLPSRTYTLILGSVRNDAKGETLHDDKLENGMHFKKVITID